MSERKTLAEMNEAAQARHAALSAEVRERIEHWGPYTLKTEIVVGQAGQRRTGTHAHMISIQRIVAENEPHRPGTLKVGDVFSSSAFCGTRSNGQRTAFVLSRLDTKDVTCDRCIKRLGWEVR